MLLNKGLGGGERLGRKGEGECCLFPDCRALPGGLQRKMQTHHVDRQTRVQPSRIHDRVGFDNLRRVKVRGLSLAAKQQTKFAC
ncbi:hypothetical protein [Dyella sp. GSA-30]|uniref:hypothetical protein n=1 Tax=Dyella sp. GSA-30 TaxID=2994496 RepID=UPI002491112E|nr:hypothetical protein [Dyella sp. GSA-30]